MLGVVAVLTENVTLLAVSISAVTEVTAAAWGAMVEVSAQQRSACGCRGRHLCRGRSSIPVRRARRGGWVGGRLSDRATANGHGRRLCRVTRLDVVLAQGRPQPFQFGIQPV